MPQSIGRQALAGRSAATIAYDRLMVTGGVSNENGQDG